MRSTDVRRPERSRHRLGGSLLCLALASLCLGPVPALADPGYEGAGHGVHVPAKKPAGVKELDINTRTRNALLIIVVGMVALWVLHSL